MNEHFPELDSNDKPAESENSDGNWRLILFEIAVYAILLWGLLSMTRASPMYVS